MKELFLLVTLVFSFSALAADVEMVKISSDLPGEEDQVYRMVVEVKEDMEIVAFHKDKLGPSGEIEMRKSYSLDDIEGGYVMEHQEGRDIIILSSNNFDSYVGGDLRIAYLFNGLKNKWRAKNVKLRFMGGEWRLQTSNVDVIKKMKIIVRKWVGKIVGVKDIEFSK
ncbi:MAG: hypothetical protein CME70_23675 [Halobacteriovorax sp.]|nr:hypothetical protein [Halobacteriovorax sp.]|tara:strand:+ start:106241 stop:106741 length:501 start_codon:yes stop_codon:yes gene_type:complete